MAGGDSYREVAVALGIKWHTVQTHTRNICRKLGVSWRLEAIEAARTLRLL